jgi:hypothetical protein
LPSGYGTATFRWNYSDTESDTETRFQMQVSLASGTDFERNIVFDSGMVNGSVNKVQIPVLPYLTNPPNSINCQNNCTYSPDFCVLNCNYINYGLHYYWRVKVWEITSSGATQDSGWVYYVDSASDPVDTYIYPYAHPSPILSYSVPPSVAPGQAAVFSDSSKCYKDDGTQYNCSDKTLGATNTYTWWYNTASHPTSDLTYTVINAPPIISKTYQTPGTYTTKMQICDDIGCCVAPTQNIAVGTSNANTVPQWWEISPY